MKKIIIIGILVLSSLYAKETINTNVEIENLKNELKELKEYKNKQEKKEKEKENLKKLNALLPVNNNINNLTVLSSSSGGRSLYRRCMGCHGAHGDVKALGISKKISSMTPIQIKKAIIGYQNGTYGGRKRLLMKSYVSGIREENNINILSNYISRLDNN